MNRLLAMGALGVVAWYSAKSWPPTFLSVSAQTTMAKAADEPDDGTTSEEAPNGVR
jgi:hypothetical protein